MSTPAPLVREVNFQVCYFDVDPAWGARLHTVCNLFQEAAGRHALELGIGIHQLLGGNLTWILGRLSVEMDSYPRAGDSVTVRTRSLGFHRLYAYRSYELLDAAGRLIGRGMSQWVVLDTATGKVVRPSEELVSHVTARLGAAPDMPKIPEFELVEREKRLIVRAQDLDMNRHVNNAAYVGFIQESLLDPASPESFTRHPRRFEIAYRDQAVYGDELLSQAGDISSSHTLHRIVRACDGKELARAECLWG